MWRRNTKLAPPQLPVAPVPVPVPVPQRPVAPTPVPTLQHPKPYALSYAQYQVEMERRRTSGVDKWIYDILDGRAEQSTIVAQHQHFIITFAPDHSTQSPHLLAIPRDQTLHSIRDLTIAHIAMLQEMRATSIQYIQSIPRYNRTHAFPIATYFHYPPSTFHLHLHISIGRDSWRNIKLDDVVRNIQQNANYYRQERRQEPHMRLPQPSSWDRNYIHMRPRPPVRIHKGGPPLHIKTPSHNRSKSKSNRSKSNKSKSNRSKSKSNRSKSKSNRSKSKSNRSKSKSNRSKSKSKSNNRSNP